MDDSLHAARMGDLILHPPLMAELVSGLVEAAVYAAAVAAVGAAIGGAVVAVVGTGGAAAALTPLIAGAMVSAAAMLPAGEDKSIGDHISDFSNWVGNSMFPPEPYGSISSGSHNTRINGILAARAAGVSGGPVAEPEPGEEPSILENIGAYAMVGASMVMPVIGLAQEINSIFNPPVTTPAAPGSIPKPEDKAVCSKHPPMPEQFVAQGSDKVFINGQPAARVGDKTTCDGPIGMTYSPNVRIGGGTTTVRDIHDGKSAAAKIIGLIAGMLISRRSRARPKPRNAPKPHSPVIRCHANPVVVSTGAKIQQGVDDTDFQLAALVPIDWARRYDSSDTRREGLFGMGWSVPYEARVERVNHPEGGELWVYVDDEGARLELGRLQVGSAFVSSLDGLAFFHQEGGITVVEDIYSGQYQVFAEDPHAPRCSRLILLGDRNLNQLELRYDDQGRLQYLFDGFGRTAVELLHDSQHPRRVSEIRRLYLHPGDGFQVAGHERLVSYSYTAGGQLQAVYDVTGQCRRRFTYTAEGLMASHVLPTGAERFYAWSLFNTPERRPPPCHVGDRLPPMLEPVSLQEWRVVRQWGSEGEEYRFEYDLEQGITRVTDGLGREDRYRWGPFYEVYEHIDALGQCWRDDIRMGRLLGSCDPQGNQWHYTYDDIGRLIAIEDPLGRNQTITYTRHWALPLSITDTAGNQRRFTYDSRGNLLSAQDPLGHHKTFSYDQQGRNEQVTDALGKQRSMRWNAAGQLLRFRDCSGRETVYRYDARGQVVEAVNARGRRVLYRYDERGCLIERERPSGLRDRYQFDVAGLLLRHTAPDNRSTAWRYDCAGRLLQRVDALGNTVEYRYDAYGRLLQLLNENREAFRFSWDSLDRPLEQRNLDGGGQRYCYTAAGTLASIIYLPSSETGLDDMALPPELRHDFEYDAVARLVARRTADGITRYEYDLADRLVGLSFTDLGAQVQRLHFCYDSAGQLLSEGWGDERLGFDYDSLGNLQTLTLADGRRVNHLYYGSGHLHQVNLDGRIICDFERDELHEEVLRTQGALHTRQYRDHSGRIVQRSVHADVSEMALPLLSTDYQYNDAGNLVAERFTQHGRGGVTADAMIGRFIANGQVAGLQGMVRYDYGPTERIHGLSRDMPGTAGRSFEAFGYDRAGNLLDGYGINVHVANDRLRGYQDKRYRYDRFGRLCEKRTGVNRVQYFDYDAEHRLTQVRQTWGSVQERVVFSYDPMGRRTRKALYRGVQAQPVSVTLFRWQGLRLLEEVQDGRSSLFLYRSASSHEPIARVDGAGEHARIGYFHNHLSGLPQQFTDEQGVTRWQAEYRAWGNSHAEWHCPGEGVTQNLRMQGQYLDRETGLHYNLSRYYDPDIGRFTQPDPIGLGGGINLYRYAANIFTRIDPLGLSSFDPYEHGEYTEFPKDLHFGQDRAAPQFSTIGAQVPEIAGKQVLDVADDLRNNRLSPEKLEIAYTKDPRSGKFVTLNNRGLAALMSANTYPKYAVFVPYEHAPAHLVKDFANRDPVRTINLTRNKDGSGLVATVSPCP